MSRGPRCPPTSAPLASPHLCARHPSLPSLTPKASVILDSSVSPTHMQPIRDRPAPHRHCQPPASPPACLQPRSGLFHNLLLGALIPAHLLRAPPGSHRDPFNPTQQRLPPTHNPTAAPFSLTAKAYSLPTATGSHAIRLSPPPSPVPDPHSRSTASTPSRRVVVTTPIG